MIPENIKREHILKAVEEADKLGVPLERKSEGYDLEYNKKTYPPKYIVSLANKYANNYELAHSTFSGGDETNGFLQSLDFSIVNKKQDEVDDIEQQFHDFAPRLKKYLENKYSLKVKKGGGRGTLSFPSNTIIHVRGSTMLKDGRGFYHLQEEDQKDIIENVGRFFAAVFGEPENTFVFPKEAIKTLFSSYPLTLQEGKKPKWYFDIRQENNGSHYLKIHSGEAKDINIDNYLNRWDQIDDFRTSKPPKSFLDLQRFILTIKMRANYQLIMVRTLLSGGKASKDSIALQIKELNPNEPEKDFSNIPVYGVLEKELGIVKKEPNNEFVLNVEKLTSEQISQLIALCNWKMINLPLQLEEVINAFDKNKSLFNPDRLTLEEREKLRSSFVSDFPIDKIIEMKLDDYVAGKRDSNSNQVNKETFCYRLERELGVLSSISGTVAQKFGIFFRQTTKDYGYDKEKYDSPKKAFDAIKSEIYTILQAGKQFKEDRDWNRLSEVLERDYNIYKMIRSKILSIYYPEEFVQIHSIRKLREILKTFGKSTDDLENNLSLLQARLLEFKNNNPVMKQWHNEDFSHFAWEVVIERKGGESESDEKYDLEKSNINTKPSLWVVRAGSKGAQEKDALENNVVTIAWNQLPDLSNISNKQNLKQLYLKNSPNAKEIAVTNMVGSIWRFTKEIKNGDLAVLPLLSQGSKTIAIGKVEGGYRYEELSPEIKHIRPVKWLGKNILKSEFDKDIIKRFQIPMTVYEIKGNNTIQKVKRVLNKYGITDADMDGLNLIETQLKKETESIVTLEDISRQTYFSPDMINEIEILLNEKKQIILYGPPGTSKTYFAKIFARYFTRNVDNIALIQFHPSYSYEDFIEGIKPNLSDTGQANGFSKQDGIFKKLVKKCNADPNNNYVLIIDEINRGNIAKIFGELIYLLEYREEKVTLTYSPNENFSIPSNLYLIGTMNSADKSIAFVDYALRRRFYFKDFCPDSNVNLLREWFEDHPPNQIASESVINMLDEINYVIVERLGREYQIGHSYLMKRDLDNVALKRIIDYAIIPLLEQYFFGKKERLEELKEICNKAIIPILS